MDGGRSGGDGDRPVVRGPTTNSPSLVVITFSHSVQEPPSPGAISICPPESQTVSQLPTARVQRRRRTSLAGASEPPPPSFPLIPREENWRKEGGREGGRIFFRWPRTRANTELFYGRGRVGSRDGGDG